MAAANRAAALAANSHEAAFARDRALFLGAAGSEGPEAPGGKADPAAQRARRREGAARFGRKALASFMAVVLAVGLMPLPAFGDDGQVRGVSFNGNLIAGSVSTTTTVDADGNTTTETTQTKVDDEGNVVSETTSSEDGGLDGDANLRGQYYLSQATSLKSDGTIQDLAGTDIGKVSEDSDSRLSVAAGAQALEAKREEEAAKVTYDLNADGLRTPLAGETPAEDAVLPEVTGEVDQQAAVDGDFTVADGSGITAEGYGLTGWTAADTDGNAHILPAGAQVTSWGYTALTAGAGAAALYIEGKASGEDASARADAMRAAGWLAKQASAWKAAAEKQASEAADDAARNQAQARADAAGAVADTAAKVAAGPSTDQADYAGARTSDADAQTTAEGEEGSPYVILSAAKDLQRAVAAEYADGEGFTDEPVTIAALDADSKPIALAGFSSFLTPEGATEIASSDEDLGKLGAQKQDASLSAALDADGNLPLRAAWTRDDDAIAKQLADADEAAEAAHAQEADDSTEDGDTNNDNGDAVSAEEGDAEEGAAQTPSDFRAIIATQTLDAEDEPHVLSAGAGVYLLGFATQDEAAQAVARYQNREGVAFAALDAVVSVADDEDDASTASDAQDVEVASLQIADFSTIESEGEKLADEAGVEDGSAAPLVALVDTGAPWHNNVVSRSSTIEGVTYAELDDDNGHGTAMLGAFLAENPDARVVSIKALDSTGYGTAAAVYAAIEQAIEARATIINLSFAGYDVEGNAAIAEAVADATAAGIAIIAAAGNAGTDARYFTPANAESAFTVGALNESSVMSIRESLAWELFGSEYASADSAETDGGDTDGMLSQAVADIDEKASEVGAKETTVKLELTEAQLAELDAALANVIASDAEAVLQSSSNRGDTVDAYVMAESTSYAAARVSGWLSARGAEEGWQDKLPTSALAVGDTASFEGSASYKPTEQDSRYNDDGTVKTLVDVTDRILARGVEAGVWSAANTTSFTGDDTTYVKHHVNGNSQNYIDVMFSRDYQVVTLPPGKYKMETWGASGGGSDTTYSNATTALCPPSAPDDSTGGTSPGAGGYTYGEVTLDKTTTLYVFVGQRGAHSIGTWNSSNNALSSKKASETYTKAYNGGGYGDVTKWNAYYWAAHGGGGMTHISLTNNVAVAQDGYNGTALQSSGYGWNQGGTIVLAGGGGATDDGNAGTAATSGGGFTSTFGYSAHATNSNSGSYLSPSQTAGWARGVGSWLKGGDWGAAAGGAGWYGGYAGTGGAGGSGGTGHLGDQDFFVASGMTDTTNGKRTNGNAWNMQSTYPIVANSAVEGIALTGSNMNLGDGTVVYGYTRSRQNGTSTTADQFLRVKGSTYKYGSVGYQASPATDPTVITNSTNYDWTNPYYSTVDWYEKYRYDGFARITALDGPYTDYSVNSTPSTGSRSGVTLASSSSTLSGNTNANEGDWQQFDYNGEAQYGGSVQEFTVPYTGEYMLQAWGAAGGYWSSGGGQGAGGYTYGTVKLRKGQKLYVFAGESGLHADANTNTYGAAYNGGGYIGAHNGNTGVRGHGGGMTHISTKNNPTPTDFASDGKYGSWMPKSAWDTGGTLIVAGGGGGGDDGSSSSNTYVGVGGGWLGGDGVGSSSWATLVPGGGQTASGYSWGAKQGVGGGYNDSTVIWDRGTGGGGWYGGQMYNFTYGISSSAGSKYTGSNQAGSNGGAAGGSGFVNGSGWLADFGETTTDSKHMVYNYGSLSGRETFEAVSSSSTEHGHLSSGAAKITLIDKDGYYVTYHSNAAKQDGDFGERREVGNFDYAVIGESITLQAASDLGIDASITVDGVQMPFIGWSLDPAGTTCDFRVDHDKTLKVSTIRTDTNLYPCYGNYFIDIDEGAGVGGETVTPTHTAQQQGAYSATSYTLPSEDQAIAWFGRESSDDGFVFGWWEVYYTDSSGSKVKLDELDAGTVVKPGATVSDSWVNADTNDEVGWKAQGDGAAIDVAATTHVKLRAVWKYDSLSSGTDGISAPELAFFPHRPWCTRAMPGASGCARARRAGRGER